VLGKPHSLGRHAVDIRRFEKSLPLAGEIAVAEIVG
jgi:hypothetical protein